MPPDGVRSPDGNPRATNPPSPRLPPTPRLRGTGRRAGPHGSLSPAGPLVNRRARRSGPSRTRPPPPMLRRAGRAMGLRERAVPRRAIRSWTGSQRLIRALVVPIAASVEASLQTRLRPTRPSASGCPRPSTRSRLASRLRRTASGVPAAITPTRSRSTRMRRRRSGDASRKPSARVRPSLASPRTSRWSRTSSC